MHLIHNISIFLLFLIFYILLQEDATVATHLTLPGGGSYDLLCVFDGHGGAFVSTVLGRAAETVVYDQLLSAPPLQALRNACDALNGIVRSRLGMNSKEKVWACFCVFVV